MVSFERIITSPISYRPISLAATDSNVCVLMHLSIDCISTEYSAVVSLSVILQDLTRGFSASQNNRALKIFDSNGGDLGSLAICPRSTKICSSSVNATDLPALNVSCVIVSFQVSNEETFAVLFEGEKSNVSPIDKLPVSIRPTRIRRSSNLYISCIGNRSGPPVSGSFCSIESIASRNVGPSYQVINSEIVISPSPSRAEMGTIFCACIPIRLR